MIVADGGFHVAGFAVDGVLDIGEAAGKVVGVVEVKVVKLYTIAEDREGEVGVEDNFVKEPLGTRGASVGSEADGADLIVDERLADEFAIEVLGGGFEIGVDVGVVHIVCCFLFNTNIQNFFDLIVKM